MKFIKQIVVLVVCTLGFTQAASSVTHPRIAGINKTLNYSATLYSYNIDKTKSKQKNGFYIDQSTFVVAYNAIDMMYHANVNYGAKGTCVVGNVKAADKKLGLAVLEVKQVKKATDEETSDQLILELPKEGAPLLSPGDNVWFNQLPGNAVGKVSIVSIRELTDGKVGDLLVREDIEGISDLKYCYQTDSSPVDSGLPVFNIDNVLVGVTTLLKGSSGVIVLPASLITELTPCPPDETLEKRYKRNMLTEIVSLKNEVRARQRGADWVDSFSECYEEGRVWDGKEWVDVEAVKIQLAKLQKSSNVKRRKIEYANSIVYPTGCYEYNGHILLENEYSEIVPEVQEVVIYAKPSRVTGKVADMARLRSEVQQREAMLARSRNSAMQRRSAQTGSRMSMPASSMGGIDNTTTFQASQFDIERPTNNNGWLFTIDGLKGKVAFNYSVLCSSKSGQFEMNSEVVWSGKYGIFKNSSGNYERIDLYTQARNSDPVYIHAMYSPEPIDEHAMAWILYCQGIEQMLKDGNIEPQADCECCGGTGWVTCALCKGSGSLSLRGNLCISEENDADQPVVLGSRRLEKATSMTCPALCCEGKMACPECVLIDRPTVKNEYKSEYIKERQGK